MTIKVQKAAMMQLFSLSPYALGGTFVIMLLVGFVFYGMVPDSLLFLGFVLHMVALFFRGFVCKTFAAKKADIEDLSTLVGYTRLYIIGTLLTGILWGMSFVLLLFESSMSYQFFIYTIVVGLAGAAIVTLSSIFEVYLAFMVPMLGLSAIYAFVQDGGIYKSTAFFLLVLMAFLYMTGRNYSKNLIDSLADKENLIETQNEIVSRLSKAGEFRDNETGMHIVRMSHMSALLAQKCGFSEEFVQNMKIASEMHDIGKIGIPDTILLKPAKLNDEEWKIMQQHTTIGKKILENSDSKLIKLSESIAYTHHEKYDGSGYPNALAGDAIPIEGRIVAVCDVFDALVSERPYKESWSHEAALEYLKEQSGKHFDPELVEKFCEIYPQVEEFYKIYHDKAIV